MKTERLGGPHGELQEESHIIIPPHDLINGGRMFWHVDGELRAELFAFFGHNGKENSESW